MTSIKITINGSEVTLDDKGKCRKCDEPIVHVASSGIWLHVGFVKGQKTYKDYKHQAQG